MSLRDVSLVRSIAWLALAGSGVVPVGPSDAQDVHAARTELMLSVAVGPAFALGKAAQAWANAIGQGSGGTLAATLHPGATLAQRDPTREFAALRDGAADLAVGSTLFWSTQVDALGVVGLPWLAAEPAELAALADGEVREQLFAAVERAGVKPLALAPLGHRAIATTTRSVRTPGDVARLAIRITSTPYLVELYAGLGGQPNAIPFAEADAAFRSGALNAQEGMAATFASARIDALGFKYVTLWGAVGEIAVFAANPAAWARLTPAQQSALQDSARIAADDLARSAAAEEQVAIGLMQSHGVAMLRLTRSGRAAFAAATRPVYDRWAAVAGPSLVRAAEDAIERTRQ
jgi:TRAP-type C4-dicarboxylate transport system substrate-binding protein